MNEGMNELIHYFKNSFILTVLIILPEAVRNDIV